MHLQVFGSEHHVKKESTFFFSLNAENGFFKNLNQKISPLSVQKNISDGVESRNGSNDKWLCFQRAMLPIQSGGQPFADSNDSLAYFFFLI
jgi:hypothetical protein